MRIVLTHTAYTKIRQWKNLKGEAAEKLVRRAFGSGTDIRDIPANERAYYESYIAPGRKAYVYAGCCFVFAGDCYESRCVAVLRGPSAGQLNKFDGKVRVKNKRKYAKHYAAYSYDYDGSELCA